MLGGLQGVTCIIAQEGPFGRGRDPLPDTNGLGVAGVSTLRLLIEAPVPVTKSTGLWVFFGWGGWTGAFSLWGRGCSPVLLEEEGVTCGFPPDGRVDVVIGDAQAIAGQWLWVARLQVRFSEEPVAVTCRSGGWARTGLGLRGLCGEGTRGMRSWAHKSIHIHGHTHTHTLSLSPHIHIHTIIPLHIPKTTHSATHLHVTRTWHSWAPATYSYTYKSLTHTYTHHTSHYKWPALLREHLPRPQTQFWYRERKEGEPCLASAPGGF